MGINLKEARTETEKIIGRGSGFVAVEIPFTPRAKRVLELSLEEARQLGVLSTAKLALHTIFVGDKLQSVCVPASNLILTALSIPCRTQLHWDGAHLAWIVA